MKTTAKIELLAAALVGLLSVGCRSGNQASGGDAAANGSGGGSGGASSSSGSGGSPSSSGVDSSSTDRSSSSSDGGADDGGGGGGGMDATVVPSTDAAVDGGVQGPCTAGTLAKGDSTVMVQSGGARSFLLHVPPQYDGRTRVPLVIDMHGLGQSPGGEEGGSGWRAKADAVGFVVMYPQGLNLAWNGGPLGCTQAMCCCEPAVDNKVDDVSYLRAAVAKTAQDGCIDLKRVYATGLSNGGVMSHWLGCNAADLFAAVAPVSGGLLPGPLGACKLARPVSIVEYRGRMDGQVPYGGGQSSTPPPVGHVWPSAMADFTTWAGLNGCTDAPMPMPMHPICQIQSKCGGGAEVVLCSPNAGHVLYGGAAQEMAAVPDVAWEVFKRHALP